MEKKPTYIYGSILFTFFVEILSLNFKITFQPPGSDIQCVWSIMITDKLSYFWYLSIILQPTFSVCSKQYCNQLTWHAGCFRERFHTPCNNPQINNIVIKYSLNSISVIKANIAYDEMFPGNNQSILQLLVHRSVSPASNLAVGRRCGYSNSYFTSALSSFSNTFVFAYNTTPQH